MKMSKTLLLCLMILSFAACSVEKVPSPTSTPATTPVPSTMTLTPLPTVTPSPMPTPTPTPVWQLTIHWPEPESAVLPPAPVEVELRPSVLEEVPPINVMASVLDPDGIRYDVFVLTPYSGYLYRAETSLQFPLIPKAGDWKFSVAIQSSWPVTGEQTLLFLPQLPTFRVLTDTLPSGVYLSVPEAFSEVLAEGDMQAGARKWQYAEGSVGLWWAPGPAEPLLFNTALVMLETTYPTDWSPEVTEAEETTWENNGDPLVAFRFKETWPDSQAGSAEAWVIQAPDHWLYVLRARGIDQETVPALFKQVAETFLILEE